MVRINIISPEILADQHLIAEYNEILMLFGHVKKYPEAEDIPEKYVLGRGHITFFKDKLLYLKKRHELLRQEMRRRGFNANVRIELDDYPEKLHNDWSPGIEDYKVIGKRLKQKIAAKPDYYRYEGMPIKPRKFMREYDF